MELDRMTGGGLHAYPAPRGGPAAKPNVILQIGKCRAEMLEHVRRTHRHLLTEVSKQVERELKGLHRSVGKLESNLDGYVPGGDSQRWKRSIKACLSRCQETVASLERWVKREMHVWREVFYRLERWADRLEGGGAKYPVGAVSAGGPEGYCQEADPYELAVSPYAITPPPASAELPGGEPADAPYPPWGPGEDGQPSPGVDTQVFEDPREFLSHLEEYLRQVGGSEEYWLSQIQNHMNGPAKKWWEFKQRSVKNWVDFKKEFLLYGEGAPSREAVQRELDLPQKQGEPLDQFLWRKRDLYQTLYVDAEEEEVIQYVVGTLQPKLKRFLRHPLPKTLEQLIQRGAGSPAAPEKAAPFKTADYFVQPDRLGRASPPGSSGPESRLAQGPQLPRASVGARNPHGTQGHQAVDFGTGRDPWARCPHGRPRAAPAQVAETLHGLAQELPCVLFKSTQEAMLGALAMLGSQHTRDTVEVLLSLDRPADWQVLLLWKALATSQKLARKVMTQLYVKLRLRPSRETLRSRPAELVSLMPRPRRRPPGRTCLEALKGLFWTTNYWEVFAYLKLQRGWELLERLDTYAEGVALLARAMAHYDCEVKAVLGQAVIALKSPEERDNVVAILIITEFLNSQETAQYTAPQAMGQFLGLGLDSPHPLVRATSLKGLGSTLLHPKKVGLLQKQLAVLLDSFLKAKPEDLLGLMSLLGDLLRHLGHQGISATSLKMAQHLLPLFENRAKATFLRCAILLRWEFQKELFSKLAWGQGPSAENSVFIYMAQSDTAEKDPEGRRITAIPRWDGGRTPGLTGQGGGGQVS
ncbi:PREDICTED: activity-regulated cytoskeleton-associated protein [Condylura cristata]|uniref:activity-regulated cytoskeleton-associated protein n=1 Tax=Condylura cristata TaxID=143302 RepID=UPI000642B534|nr:PREDICTED: activity-regulated cytoskeleton-associated protein [Condylura cristata]